MWKLKLCLLVAGAVALTACSGASKPELAIMEEAPTELPAWVSGPEGLPTNDLAHVADVDQSKVFASRDDDNWCVLLAIEPTSEGSTGMTSAACAPAKRFASDGVWVETGGSSTGLVGALLLPDDFSGEIEDDWERVNDNLAVRR